MNTLHQIKRAIPLVLMLILLTSALSACSIPTIPTIPTLPQIPDIPSLPDTPDVPDLPDLPDPPEQILSAFNPDGTLNNEFWGIVPNSSVDAQKNSERFTAALDWCHENGYHAVKVAQDTYYVEGDNSAWYRPSSPYAIFIPSDTELDLNGATFIHVDNDRPSYMLFAIYQSQNVRLYNGILVGDNATHPQNTEGFLSHEFGFGVDIRGSSNVVIDDLEIYGMTGDAVIISGDDIVYGAPVGGPSEQVTITKCRIHDCRRQGISVIGGNEIWIQDNEIYNISGYMPMSGIDLEGEVDWPVSNIHIVNNRIYATQTANIIVNRQSQNIDIRGNDLTGIVGFAYGDTITIANNTINDGGIYCIDVTVPLEAPTNIIIEDNTLTSSEIRMHVLRWVVIRNNTLTDGSINLMFANGAIYDNTIINTNPVAMPSAILVYSDSDAGRNKVFKAYVCDNIIMGSFQNPVAASGSTYVTVLSDRTEMMTFMEEIRIRGILNVGLDIAS
jgi:hypothetical protein